MNESKKKYEKIKDCLIEAIEIANEEFLSSTKISGNLDKDYQLSELKLFDDSLNTVIFFTALEQVIKKNLNKTIIIDYEKLELQDELITLNDLMRFISKNIEI
tara:strand:+ start:6705 stop:7013 length:309 start_codon:yes stop_codon:yes gene_type:complete